MSILLRDIYMNDGAAPVNMLLESGKIAAVTNDEIEPAGIEIYLNGARAFPGLINSHEHLDFNLFPHLGNPVYQNYTEWGNDIHQQHKAEINAVLRIPTAMRNQWGIYKNLLAGVTTVINHGQKLFFADPLIRVIQPNNNLHSLQFEKQWRWKLNNPFKMKQPVVIHTAEGIDAMSANEAGTLIKWNIFNKKLVCVHGVSIGEVQAAQIQAVVWCPVSNFFMFEKTAPVERLKHHTAVLFGTDSTLTAHWNIWEHLRLAQRTAKLTDQELLESVTSRAADNWQLNSGLLAVGKDADLLVVRNSRSSEIQTFFGIHPEDILLVVQQGHIRLFDSSLSTQLLAHCADFCPIVINGSVKYVEGDVSGLMCSIRKYYPQAEFPVSEYLPGDD